MMVKRVGILGGTFNPIHIGHLVIAQVALEKVKLDKVIFVPSYCPPHKKIANLAAAKHRYHMVRLAVKGNPAFEISDFEVNRPEKSYTINTVSHFRDVLPKKTKLYFIIGGDSLGELRKWKRIDEIAKMVTFISINRPGYSKKKVKYKHTNISMPGIDVASSYIRGRLNQGKTIKYLVPDSVFRYIEKNKVYKK